MGEPRQNFKLEHNEKFRILYYNNNVHIIYCAILIPFSLSAKEYVSDSDSLYKREMLVI